MANFKVYQISLIKFYNYHYNLLYLNFLNFIKYIFLIFFNAYFIIS